jgi:hypothetical protein
VTRALRLKTVVAWRECLKKVRVARRLRVPKTAPKVNVFCRLFTVTSIQVVKNNNSLFDDQSPIPASILVAILKDRIQRAWNPRD